LSDIKDHAALHRELADLTSEIARLLQIDGQRAANPSTAIDTPSGRALVVPAHNATGKTINRTVHDPSERLLVATLLQELGEADAAALARRLADGVARLTRLAGDGLFDAVRFCIEFQLLVAEEPTSPARLQQFLREPIEDDMAKRLVDELRKRSRDRDFSRTPVDVGSQFFLMTRDREELWKSYFDAVLDADVDAADKEALRSLCLIKVRYGFLAPQFLVAGLMSRFNDDWRPVLNGYQRAISDSKRSGAFESLQASQWNCWLVWGPSIPICRCRQWNGVFAFQYGYGDENNSLPAVDLETDSEGRPRALDGVAAGLKAESRGAKFVQLSGRLRWGPWYLREAADGDCIDRDDIDSDLAAEDEIGFRQAGDRCPAAPAQASLFRDSQLMFRHDSDGLTFQVQNVERISNERRVYFSAYLWMIFLVALRPEDSTVGPKLMRGKRWPERSDRGRRVPEPEAKLWEDLLPVFVHANIADPAALDFQKRQLAQNALAMLQQVWQRRGEVFDPKDVESGIQFYLVSASDYTGCGTSVRYPSGTALVDLLRERLALESDAQFAGSVVLPSAEVEGVTRPRGLARYFSSCHLPELVSDYFEFVNRLFAGGKSG
jgi:hypothetical protein